MSSYDDLHPSLRRVIDTTLDHAMKELQMNTDIVAVEVDIVVVYDEDVARLAYEFTIDYDDIAVVSVDEDNDQWPVAVFAGPEDQIAGMLMDRGYEDGIETYEV